MVLFTSYWEGYVNMSLKISLTVILFSMSIIGYGQSTVISSRYDFLNAAVNADSTKIAFFDQEKITIARRSDLHIIKQFSHNQSTDSRASVPKLFFSPLNDSIIIYQSHSDFMYSPLWEYPADSTYFYNYYNQKKTASLAGNLNFGITSIPNKYLFAGNDYYPFQVDGKTSYSNINSVLMRFPERDTIHVFKAVREIISSPDNHHYVVILYKGYEKRFEIQVRNHDLELLFKKSGFNEYPEIVEYSPTGKLLAVEKRNNKNEINEIEILDAFTGVKLSSIKNFTDEKESEDEPSFLRFSRDEKSVAVLTSNEIFMFDINTNELQMKVWPNITDLFSFNGFEILSKSEWLVYGDSIDYTRLDGPGKAEILNLNSLAIFSKTENVEVSDLSSKESFDIQYSGNSTEFDEFLWFEDRNHFILKKETGLSVWSVAEKRKMYDFNFIKDISVFPGRSQDRVLVIEDRHQSSYSGFTIHLLDFKNNTHSSRSVLPPSDGFFMNSRVKFHSIPNGGNQWLATDDSEHIWRFNDDSGAFELLYEQVNARFVEAWPLSNQQMIVWSIINEEHQLLRFSSFNSTPEVVFKSRDQLFIKGNSDELWLLEGNSKNIFVYESGKVKKVGKTAVEPDRFDVSSDGLLISSEDGEQILMDKSAVIIHSLIEQFAFCELINQKELISVNSISEGTIKSVFPGSKQEFIWSVKESKLFESTPFDVSNDGSQLLIDDVILNLITGESSIHKFQHYYGFIDINDSTYLYQDVDEPSEYYTSDKFRRVIKNPISENILGKSEVIKKEGLTDYQVLFSPNGKYLVERPSTSFGTDQKTIIRDVSSMKIIKEFKEKVFYAGFNADGNMLVLNIGDPNGLNTTDYKTVIFDINKKKIIKDISGIYISDFISDSEVISTGFGNVIRYDISGENPKIIAQYYSRDFLSKSIYDEKHDLIIAGSHTGSLYFWKKEQPGSPLYVTRAGNADINRLIIRGDKLFSVSGNSEVRMWDLSQLEAGYCRIQVLEREDEKSVFMSTNDGYYWSDKSILPYFHFVKYNQIFPFQSFDIFRNRPDKVLEKLGSTDKDLIHLYKDAWVKRVKRAGFKEDTDISALEMPEVTILNNISSGTEATASEYVMDVKVYSKTSPIQSLHFLVNGVPVSSKSNFGTNQTSQIQQKILLSEGINSISVYAVNENGVESPERFITVNHSKEVTQEPKIWFFGIGVSQYADSKRNLNYAAKDIRDLSLFFKDFKEGSVIIDTLLNGAATRKQILMLKEKLMKTSVDDVVILSLSGHGLLDENLQFYFAAHDTNFENPVEGGVKYEELMSLLDGIPARKKLMLLDACNSGEADVEAVREEEAASVTVNEYVAFRGESSNSKLGVKKSFTLMQEVFSDVSKSNGAIVISAAASNEYAYETSELKNGVFTFSVMEGIRTLSYDTWDGAQEVKISDLKKYVDKSVLELTNGNQRPTTRAENITWDWGLR